MNTIHQNNRISTEFLSNFDCISNKKYFHRISNEYCISIVFLSIVIMFFAGAGVASAGLLSLAKQFTHE